MPKTTTCTREISTQSISLLVVARLPEVFLPVSTSDAGNYWRRLFRDSGGPLPGPNFSALPKNAQSPLIAIIRNMLVSFSLRAIYQVCCCSPFRRGDLGFSWPECPLPAFRHNAFWSVGTRRTFAGPWTLQGEALVTCSSIV